MQPADIAALVTLGPPSLAPDGRHAVVAATRPDLDADEYRSALWLVAVDGSAAPRRLTHGDHDSAPVFSPDGAQIAFLRAAPKGKPQLHVLPVAGGDARPLTELRGGAGTPVWSPDSTRMAFAARVPAPGRYADVRADGETITSGQEPPRRITGLQYRLDGVGFVVDQRSRLFVVALDGGEAVRVDTDGDWDDVDPAWSPDGALLAFVSRRHPDRERDELTDVFTIAPSGGQARQLTNTTAVLSSPRWLSDGSALVAVGAVPDADGNTVARNEGLFRIEAADGAARRLTDAESVAVATAPCVTADEILVGVQHRGAVELRAVPATGGDARCVAAGPRQITGVDAAAGIVVVTYGDATTAGEVGRVDGDRVTALTSFATPGLTVPVTDFTATASDGQELHGFLALPSGDGPHPVLLLIHGGPYAQYGWTLLDEVQVYAAAGYAVVFTNPRGSSGYGEAYGRYIAGDVGERSAADLLVLLDFALSNPELDGERVGVLGGSHGGYMTTWLVGHHQRFRAAVSERAVDAIDSFEGSSDIGWYFADDLYGTEPEARHRQSPLTSAGAIETPLLIIHSEQDWRCPVEQAQRLYVALRRRGAEAELLLFPGEGHELSRSGLPSHRLARFDAILDWFARYM